MSQKRLYITASILVSVVAVIVLLVLTILGKIRLHPDSSVSLITVTPAAQPSATNTHLPASTVPPTPTQDYLAATAETLRLQEQLQQVCREGIGIPQAPAYQEDSGPHRITLFNTTADSIDSWNDLMPASWRGESAEIAELVLCISHDAARTRVADTCEYTHGGTFEKEQYGFLIQLIETQTGEIVAQDILYGSLTKERHCPVAVWSNTRYLLNGPRVGPDQVKTWLMPYIAGSDFNTVMSGTHEAPVLPDSAQFVLSEAVSVQFTSDDFGLVSISQDRSQGSAVYWDVLSGEQLRVTDYEHSEAHGFSVDSMLFATGRSNQIDLIDMSTGALIRRWQDQFVARDYIIDRLVFSPDGSYLAGWLRIEDEPKWYHLLLWDVETGEQKQAALQAAVLAVGLLCSTRTTNSLPL